MFIQLKTRNNEDILINTDNILHFTGNIGGGSVINFTGGSYIVVNDNYEDIKNIIHKKPTEQKTK